MSQRAGMHPDLWALAITAFVAAAIAQAQVTALKASL
jgi:hypothetical protein